MKFFLLIFTILLGSLEVTIAQTFTYDFGNATGTVSANTTLLSTSTAIGAFLPSTNAGGGIARARVGSGGGSINLTTELSSIGSGSKLKLVSSGTTTVNKFSIYDFDSAMTFYMKLSIRFSNADSGIYVLHFGNGGYFSNNTSTFSGDAFGGLRFVMKPNKVIQHSVFTDDGLGPISTSLFVQDSTYTVEFYANNSSTSVNYTYDNVSQSIASYKYDIYVQGIKVVDDSSKLSNFKDVRFIDSWSIFSRNSFNNIARSVVFIDDIDYGGKIPGGVLPISLVKFEATKLAEKVKLTWTTATEINNDKFIVERAAEGEDFTAIAEIIGAGTSKELNTYTFVDANPLKGTAYYRLTQVDFDGTSTSFEPVAVKMSKGALSMEQGVGSGEQGAWSIYSPEASSAVIDVKDLNGKLIYSEKIQLKEGYQNYKLKLDTQHAGLFIMQLVAGKESVTKKVKFN